MPYCKLFRFSVGHHNHHIAASQILNEKYTDKTKSIIWKADIPIDDFLSFIKFGKEEIPFGSEEPETVFIEPTEEQLKEATYFLKEITKGDHD